MRGVLHRPVDQLAHPRHAHGKPAGVRCIQLGADHRCQIFGDPDRPKVCAGLQPEGAMCGPHREHAMAWLADLESATAAETP